MSRCLPAESRPARGTGNAEPPSSTLRAPAADPADLPPPPAGLGKRRPGGDSCQARVRRASPPPPRSRGGVAKPPPTGVVDVQLVRDALVAPAEDDHQLPDGHGSVSVPGAGHRPGEGGNPPPVKEAGSRHLPNPRPSAHNAPRATGSTARGEDERRLQLCAGGPARDPRAPPPARGDVALGAPPRWSPSRQPCQPSSPVAFRGVFGEEVQPCPLSPLGVP